MAVDYSEVYVFAAVFRVDYLSLVLTIFFLAIQRFGKPEFTCFEDIQFLSNCFTIHWLIIFQLGE